VIVEIFERICRESPTGIGLVRRDPKSGRWSFIGSDKAKDKIGHALRNAAHEHEKQTAKVDARKQKEFHNEEHQNYVSPVILPHPVPPAMHHRHYYGPAPLQAATPHDPQMPMDFIMPHPLQMYSYPPPPHHHNPFHNYPPGAYGVWTQPSASLSDFHHHYEGGANMPIDSFSNGHHPQAQGLYWDDVHDENRPAEQQQQHPQGHPDPCFALCSP
jgi:hypothetical protein